VPDEQIKSIYPPAFLAQVADEFEIPSEVLERFSEAVLHAGAFYKQTKTVADDRPTLPEVQKNFELMEHHAAHLLALLDNMDDASWNSFWRAEDDIQQECVFQRSSPAMLEIGALRLVNEEQDDWEFYTRDDFPPVLKLAERVGAIATDIICSETRRNNVRERTRIYAPSALACHQQRLE
jgi:hypothetical protein